MTLVTEIRTGLLVAWLGSLCIGAAAAQSALPLPLGVPNHPSFQGMRLFFQGFVWDPAAADGFSSTAAIDMSIR